MDRIESFGSSANIAHILSSYCLASKYVFNLIGRILGFRFSAQIDRKTRSFKGKAENKKKAESKKEDEKLEKASNQCFLD